MLDKNKILMHLEEKRKSYAKRAHKCKIDGNISMLCDYENRSNEMADLIIHITKLDSLDQAKIVKYLEQRKKRYQQKREECRVNKDRANEISWEVMTFPLNNLIKHITIGDFNVETTK